MIFKNYIYINEELLQKLSKQIGIEISYDSSKESQINAKAGIGLGKISTSAEKIKTNIQSFKNDRYDLLRVFENKVMEDDTGIIDFDFDEADHIFPGQLVQFTAKVLQPKDKNQNMELITSIKQNPIFSEILRDFNEDLDSNNQKLLDFIFRNDSNIPIYFSNDEKYIVVSNISVSNLEITYEDFQDLYDEDVKVVLIVDRKYSEQQDVILMDIMKDTLKIGRDLRRTIPKNEQEKYIIKEKGPAIKGEILAMYN